MPLAQERERRDKLRKAMGEGQIPVNSMVYEWGKPA